MLLFIETFTTIDGHVASLGPANSGTRSRRDSSWKVRLFVFKARRRTLRWKERAGGGKRKCRKKKKTKEQQVPAKVNGGRNRPRSHFKFVFPWWNCRDPGMELVLSLGREFRTRRETTRGRGCRRGGQTFLLADKRNISRLRPPIKTLFIGNCKKQSWKGTEKYSDLWSPGSSGFH